MCPRCEGMGNVSDIDLTELYDDSKSIKEGALTIPGYTPDGWGVRIFSESGFVDGDKPIRDFTPEMLHDFLYKEPTKVKVGNMNLTYQGLVPNIQKSFLSKDVEAMQPHIRAFVERAVTFQPCPDCGGTRLNEGRGRPRSTASTSRTPAPCRSATSPSGCAASTTSASRLCSRTSRTCSTRSSHIGLGYLSLDRASGTLSGGEAQRTKMIRHLGSSLTDVTYVFDEPTVGLHPHDIQRMNELLLRLRDKGNTVLVVEHKPETIAIADHVVDLGPRAGSGRRPRSSTRATSRGCGQRHAHRQAPRLQGRPQRRRARAHRRPRDPRRDPPQPARRRRRRAARHPDRHHGGGRLGQELAHPRLHPEGCGARLGRSDRRSAVPGAATRPPTPGCSTRSAPRSRRPTG